MIGSDWLPSSLDVIHEWVVVNEGFQSKRISLGDCKHLPVLCMDFEHLLWLWLVLFKTAFQCSMCSVPSAYILCIPSIR